MRNNLTNDSTPTVVAASASHFFVGELAVDQLRVNPKNAVGALPNLLGTSRAAYVAAHGAPAFALEDGPAGPDSACEVALSYRGDSLRASGPLLAGLFLDTIQSFVVASEGRAPDVAVLGACVGRGRGGRGG